MELSRLEAVGRVLVQSAAGLRRTVQRRRSQDENELPMMGINKSSKRQKCVTEENEWLFVHESHKCLSSAPGLRPWIHVLH